MRIIKIRSKIHKSFSSLGRYFVKADIKTDAGFDDVKTFYFSNKKKAKEFTKKYE